MKKTLILFLSITWGLPITLIGFLIGLCFLCAGVYPKIYYGFIHFKTKKKWLGFNMGLFIFSDSSEHMEKNMPHELGHGLQNAVYGIFCLFLVHIPSVIRHWYFRYIVKFKPEKSNPFSNYYSIWFESQATEWGEKYISNYKNI